MASRFENQEEYEAYVVEKLREWGMEKMREWGMEDKDKWAVGVYMQIGPYPQPPQKEEAWYLLNVTEPQNARPSIPPEHWYKLSHWVSYGQREAIEWYVKPIRSRL